MFKKAILATVLIVPFTAPLALAQQPAVQRKVMMTQDLPTPNQQSVMVLVEIPAGGREGRHSHPRPAFAYIIDGSLTLDHEGRQSTTYKAGDAVYIEANKIHEGINNGSAPVKLIATFVVEKGKPLTTAAP